MIFLSDQTSDLKTATLVATLPGSRHYRIYAGSGQCGISMLRMGNIARVPDQNGVSRA